MIKEELKQLIADKRACIGVIGLGYVGLPLIVEFGLKGYKGIGFEVDTKKADDINAGKSYIVDVPDSNVKKCLDAGLMFRIVSGSGYQHADDPEPAGLLRARHERPGDGGNAEPT